MADTEAHIERSDADLVAVVAERLATPRSEPADSFVLHAPLELVARTALLPFVLPDARAAARRRLVMLANQFEGSGPPVPEPAPSDFASVDEAAARLVEVIDRGELEDVDSVARWLGRAASPAGLRRVLTDAVVPRLSAAAHASIFLFHLPRVAPRGGITGELLRGLARELGRNPDWRLNWIDGAAEPNPGPGPDAMFAALASTPLIGKPDNTFIYPTMSYVDTEGIAERQLATVTGGTDIDGRGRSVLRAAAWSMILEPGDHAPYGWSHCLTMPQAVLGIAGSCTDPGTALAIAATYVVGFRSALAREPLEPTFPTPDPTLALPEAIAAGPVTAAAAVWHAPPEADGHIVGELASRASVQHDAHLVKYTLACLDAAASDPEHRRLYLAAAASLVGWWAQVDDPLT